MYLLHLARPAAAPAARRLLVPSVVLLLACPGLLARAGPAPVVDFDAPFVIRCRSVPCADPTRREAGKDLIEVVVPVSLRLRAGSERDLKQCLYVLDDAGAAETLSVRDWLPRTELRTEFSRPLQFSKEGLAKVGISVSAHYIVTAAGDASGQTKSGVAYEMLPPQEAVLASGTVGQGHGVFFKLRPCSQTTLEGMKSFSAIFAVPHGWRGGCLRLRCEAVGLHRAMVPPFDREVQSGAAAYCLALYLAGDAEAERLAEGVAARQQEWLDSLAANRREVRRACDRWGTWPWLVDRLGLGGGAAATRAEAAALNDTLDRAAANGLQPDDLPRPVREKWRTLQAATTALQHLPANSPKADSPTAATGPAPATPAGRAEVSAAKPPSAATPVARTSVGVPTPDVRALPGAGLVDAPACAGKGNAAGATPSPERGFPFSLLPTGTPRQTVYFLASIAGAVFTCIVAPLVVDAIRRRIERRHQRASEPTRIA